MQKWALSRETKNVQTKVMTGKKMLMMIDSDLEA